jgi:DNA-binding transcriptional MerR regulator
MTTSLTIRQAAAATGLSAHTLRYYERIGLLDPVTRQDNQHRLYHEDDLSWIAFLLKLRTTGLPIRDMLRYAELRRQGNTRESVSARKALLEQHTRTVEQTLAELQRNLVILQHKIALYSTMEIDSPAGVITQPQSFEDISNEHSKQRNAKSKPEPESHSGIDHTHRNSQAGH